MLQVASYKLLNDFTILSMCISQHVIYGCTGAGYVEEYELNHICNLIEIFPLVCATSLYIG